jgi:hypothetical protein
MLDALAGCSVWGFSKSAILCSTLDKTSKRPRSCSTVRSGSPANISHSGKVLHGMALMHTPTQQVMLMSLWVDDKSRIICMIAH